MKGNVELLTVYNLDIFFFSYWKIGNTFEQKNSILLHLSFDYNSACR